MQLLPGHVYGLIGPNGAGKSSLLSVIAGFTPVTSGALRGTPWQRGEPVGAVFSDVPMHSGRTVRETLTLRSLYVGVDKAVVPEAARRVGLHSALGRRVGSLSLGMKMRLSIGVALLGSPSLVLLDEPMNGLDPNGIAWMRGVIAALKRDGATVIVSSHLLGELEALIDTAIVVSQGVIAWIEPVNGVGKTACRIEVNDPGVLSRALAERCISVTTTARTLNVDAPPPEVIRLAVSIGLEVFRAAPAARTLEDLYVTVSSAEFESEVRR
ncbi:ABC-2 type transport system ATP-binding protein [Curtobacterium sp. PhB130]|nr:ABC-2 type transport system ATP-binding protein [Curtobacterium sp. ZW137]ROS77505.1 ABC-2 type transport system ATP-binding protein [Curtobacterium sp. PhB130]TCK66289.1 ABC-2 type transport system ATP-binding protein [Curtobacterium sp. PhB136]